MRVLDTYALVKEKRPDVQLVLVNLLTDGAELTDALGRLRKRAADFEGVTLLTEMDRIGNVELCALREDATILIHQGMPRGISIELLEEMWQARPIVSGRSPIAEAVLTRPNVAVLADTPPDQARAILRLLERPAEARKVAEAAKARVAERHLVNHYLAGNLKLFQQLLRRKPRLTKGS